MWECFLDISVHNDTAIYTKYVYVSLLALYLIYYKIYLYLTTADIYLRPVISN